FFFMRPRDLYTRNTSGRQVDLFLRDWLNCFVLKKNRFIVLNIIYQPQGRGFKMWAVFLLPLPRKSEQAGG
ncbi:hypothetical protein ACVGXT_00290, partial [Enterobacter intestinihominis]